MEVVGFIIWPLHPPEERTPGTHWQEGWVGPRDSLKILEKGKNVVNLDPADLQTLNRPACSIMTRPAVLFWLLLVVRYMHNLFSVHQVNIVHGTDHSSWLHFLHNAYGYCSCQQPYSTQYLHPVRCPSSSRVWNLFSLQTFHLSC